MPSRMAESMIKREKIRRLDENERGSSGPDLSVASPAGPEPLDA